MNKTDELKYTIDSLCLYNVGADSVLQRLRALLDGAATEQVFALYSAFFRALGAAGGALKTHISELLVTDNNVFTAAAAGGKADRLPASVKAALRSDLQNLEALAALTKQDILDAASPALREALALLPEWETGDAVPPLTENWASQTEALTAFHRTYGYGIFVRHTAFLWRDGGLAPVKEPDPIRLTDLKRYESQRQQVVNNTLAFLNGRPANNMLLYGDRGTGKSSTVHAVLNEYGSRGLRMIEIAKGDIGALNLIRETVASSPMKFIIFIDDLSFDSHEDSFAQLKALLEGSLSGRQGNLLLYATSNRRHLIKESFADRENDVHRGDTMQEELSLSDRFGLAVYFMNPDKAEYLDIVKRIAADRGLAVPAETLEQEAELWARRRGGRSPRCARQFIDYLEGTAPTAG